jgi:uncharacterized protein (TIGR00304 family)
MQSLEEMLPFIGIVILLIGIALIIIGAFLASTEGSSRKNKDEEQEGEEKREKVRAGGVVVVGPIPIIFGTDWKAVLIAVVAAIVLIVIYTLSYF